MTFSENFVPSAESVQRLEQLAADGSPTDTRQATIQYIHAFIPVVSAIGDFPFGQPEQKLIQDVSERLTKKAMALRETIFGATLSGDNQKFAELALLQGLGDIYAGCHLAETKRLTSMGDQARETAGGMSMDPVWKAFEVKASMLEALGAALVPNKGGGAQTQAPSQAAPPPATEPVAQTPPPAAPPATPPPAAPPTTPPPQTEAASAQNENPPNTNPMSLFAKPKEQAPAAPPVAPPAEPSAAETPPPPPAEPPADQAAPPAVPPAVPPAAPPPAEPPQQPPPQAENPQQTDEKSQGPMGFFKKPSGDSENKTDES